MPPEAVDSKDNDRPRPHLGRHRHRRAHRAPGAGQEPAVLGDARAHRAVDRDRALPAVVRLGDEHRQRHPQLRALRDHGARDDLRHHHRRHRSLGRLDHGARRHRRRAVPDLGVSLVRRLRHGHARRARLRRRQRLLRRLCRHVVLRRDARHDVDRALARGGLLGQPDALQVRPRRADREGDRPGEVPERQPDSIFRTGSRPSRRTSG